MEKTTEGFYRMDALPATINYIYVSPKADG